MKVLIIVSLTLTLLVVAALGLSYQLPKESIAEKTMLVSANPDQVYAYLENPTEWERWNALNKSYDPTMIQLFGGPMRGTGARLTWNGDKVGSRQMIITGSVNPETLQYEVTHNKEQHKTLGKFELKKTEGGTLVHWLEQTPLNDNPIDLLRGAWQQYTADKQMEQGLLALKVLAEQNSKRRATR